MGSRPLFNKTQWIEWKGVVKGVVARLYGEVYSHPNSGTETYHITHA